MSLREITESRNTSATITARRGDTNRPSEASTRVICGLGPHGYELALEALASVIEAESGEAPP